MMTIEPKSEIKLLPCPSPWCEPSAVLLPEIRWGGVLSCRVECQSCGLQGPDVSPVIFNENGEQIGTRDAEAGAIEAWNTRPATQAFSIGQKVQIVPETAGEEWRGDPPQFITGIDWHRLHGVTYTTSEVWPPRVSGLFVNGLTDEWQQHHLRAVTDEEPAR